jgi:protein-S-isoprenylcysteine O-methyltransferase Ste14
MCHTRAENHELRKMPAIYQVLVLQTAGWLVCAVYATIPSFWLAIHPFANYWRKRRSAYRAILPVWLAMWVAAAGASAPWRRIALYSSGWAWIPAGLLLGTGLWLYFRAGNGFSVRQLGGLPEVVANHPEQRLVTSGIRAYVRHPIYLGHLCEMVAWSLGTGLVVCYGLTAFAVLTGFIMIRLEDKELEQRFGEDFRAYRQRVPAVVPRL